MIFDNRNYRCRDIYIAVQVTKYCFVFKIYIALCWGAGKSLAQPGRKQVGKHIRNARDLNNIETRAVIQSLFLQGKAPKEIHTILTETLVYCRSGRAKNLSAPIQVLSPCSIFLLGNPVVAQLPNKFHALYENQWLIILFTTARYWSISSAIFIATKPLHIIPLKI